MTTLKYLCAGLAAENKTFGRFAYLTPDGLFHNDPPDYHATRESGIVVVDSLPPGDYEIYNFGIFANGGMVQNTYGSRVDFSIPFTVKPGATTYLGNYQANRITGKNILGLPLAAGAVFVVSDRLGADLPIAQAKSKTPLGSASDATPDPKAMGNPFFVSPQEAGAGE